MKSAIKTTTLLVALTAANLAFAQTSTSGSTSTATTSAGSTAGSIGNSITIQSSPGGTLANPTVTDSYSTVTNQGTSTIRTNPAIAAPALTTTLTDTCMGSFSLGMSFTGFGATGGSTMVDQACVRRLDSREFRAMGLNDVALALLCQSPANKKAVEATGRLCPGTQPPVAAASPATPAVASTASSAQREDPYSVTTVTENAAMSAQAASADTSGVDITDPAMRHRLGLN